ncbi:hypothetical protein BDC45DRAFT_577142 [Circinella umbellata]|nr:hypothetical protein BDC45DRAFT_577142 [Circinella umbellata]
MSQQQQQSYIQMMNHHYYQGIPVTPVEAMILMRLDHLEDLILASKNQAVEALEEPVEEDASDDEPPAEFICQPRNAQDKVRNAKMADVEAAILALTNMDNSAKRLKMAVLELERTTMDFINYQPETDAYGYADSNDEMDFESTAIEYKILIWPRI